MRNLEVPGVPALKELTLIRIVIEKPVDSRTPTGHLP